MMTGTEATYMALLLLPHNNLRTRLQPELAACRDALALTTGRDAETIQNAYEAVAHELRKFIECLPAIAKAYPTERSDRE